MKLYSDISATMQESDSATPLTSQTSTNIPPITIDATNPSTGLRERLRNKLEEYRKATQGGITITVSPKLQMAATYVWLTLAIASFGRHQITHDDKHVIEGVEYAGYGAGSFACAMFLYTQQNRKYVINQPNSEEQRGEE